MAQINLRVDDDTKRNAEKTLDEIGLSMSTAKSILKEHELIETE